LETGKILFGKNTDQQLPMASLTKLMTILVILDKHNPDEIVTVDKRATQVEPAKMYLLANEEITISELIKAILVKSANDAALALAYHDSASIEEFAQKMNDKAAEIGLRHTNFVNPVGFDNPNQYSTVDDLAILARLTYKNPLVKQFAPITKTTATAVNGSQSHDLDTTNDLLSSYLKVWGLKTGTTDLAGQCLISIVESPTGQKILNIVLNSPARFTESKILSQWIFDNYQWL
jgi:D-alanyl-D-alanine carboxypeptidase (penicillin-binding protein 5/6)